MARCCRVCTGLVLVANIGVGIHTHEMNSGSKCKQKFLVHGWSEPVWQGKFYILCFHREFCTLRFSQQKTPSLQSMVFVVVAAQFIVCEQNENL